METRSRIATSSASDNETGPYYLEPKSHGVDPSVALASSGEGEVWPRTRTAVIKNIDPSMQRSSVIYFLPQGYRSQSGPRLQLAKGRLHGGGGAGASLVERLGAQGGVEGLGLDGSVIVDLDQRTQEALHRNDARGGR